MPQKLRCYLEQGSEPIIVTLRKITREQLYGIKTVEKRLEDGAVLDRVPVTRDGAHFLPTGSVNSQYLTESGLYAPDVIPADLEGHPLPLYPDMFATGILLDQTVTIEDFFRYDVTRVYLLEDASENLGPSLEDLRIHCEHLLLQNELILFKFAWRATAFPSAAIIVPGQDGNLFVLVGTHVPITWARLNIDLGQIFTDAEKEEEESEFNFQLW